MLKNGILARGLEAEYSFTRDRVTEALADCILNRVIAINQELDELELDIVSPEEFIMAFGKSLILLGDFYPDEEVEDAEENAQ